MIIEVSMFDQEIFNKGFKHMDITDSVLQQWYVPYLAGWFKKSGVIENDKCFIHSENIELLDTIAKKINIPYTVVDNILIYNGNNAIDFLNKLYPGEEFYSHFTDNKLLHEPGSHVPICKFTKTMENAVVPFKSNASDVGYDLTIIGVKKQINDKCTLYTTGITIDIEHGWYTEIVPRSSIIKTGYMLANSVGIIENSYRGELMIALNKIDDSAPPIELPNRCCQLIIRKQHHARFIENNLMSKTLRNEGGFGSTS